MACASSDLLFVYIPGMSSKRANKHATSFLHTKQAKRERESETDGAPPSPLQLRRYKTRVAISFILAIHQNMFFLQQLSVHVPLFFIMPLE